MKRLPALIAFILLSLDIIAQAPQKAVLQFESNLFSLEVTKDNRFVLVTRAGEVATSNSIDSPWMKPHIPAIEEEGIVKPSLDNASFFNKDTGFLSGFINNNGKYSW